MNIAVAGILQLDFCESFENSYFRLICYGLELFLVFIFWHAAFTAGCSALVHNISLCGELR